jgi:hypothetical protein
MIFTGKETVIRCLCYTAFRKSRKRTQVLQYEEKTSLQEKWTSNILGYNNADTDGKDSQQTPKKTDKERKRARKQ